MEEIRVRGRELLDPLLLGWRQRGGELPRDSQSDLALYGEDVRERPFVLFRPARLLRRGIDQLHGDAHAATDAQLQEMLAELEAPS